MHFVYPIRYIKGVPDRVLSLNLLSAEPMLYKVRLGARFVYPIGYSMYVPNQVQISLYPPYFEGLLEFCIRGPTLMIWTMNQVLDGVGEGSIRGPLMLMIWTIDQNISGAGEGSIRGPSILMLWTMDQLLSGDGEGRI